MITAIVRLCIRNDSRRVWEIRFSSTVNQYAIKQEIVTFSKHDEWFNRMYFNVEGNKCFILTVDTLVVGYCRFDAEGKKKYVVSIALDSNFQGKGLGYLLLTESLSRMQGKNLFVATIKKENLSSFRLFKKSGFYVYDENAKNYFLKNKQ